MNNDLAINKLKDSCIKKSFEEYSKDKKKEVISNLNSSVKKDKYVVLFIIAWFLYPMYLFNIDINNENTAANIGCLIMLLFFSFSIIRNIIKDRKELKNANNNEFSIRLKKKNLLNEYDYELHYIKTASLSLNDLKELEPFIKEIKNRYESNVFDNMLKLVLDNTKVEMTHPSFFYELFKNELYLAQKSKEEILIFKNKKREFDKLYSNKVEKNNTNNNENNIVEIK